MKVLITGASGFVGQVLAASLLSSGHTVILTDIVTPPIPSPDGQPHPNCTAIQADLCVAGSSPESALPQLLSADLDAIYVLHGIMSSGSEANLELGYRVNLLSTMHLLDAVRATCQPGIRIIYASSCAAYGAPLPPLPSEATLPTPEGSYGTQKLMVELLLNDYTRRGLVTAFSVRLPSITVRAGAPTAAASSWMSGVIREPLQGIPTTLPVMDDGFQCWVCSPKTLVRNLEKCLTLPRDCMEPHIRQVLLPGTTVTVGEMMAALRAVGGEEAVTLVRRENASEEVMRLFESWPVGFNVERALAIGFEPAGTFLEAVEEFAAGLKR